MQKLYLNNCVTTRPAGEVVDAMMPYLQDRFYFPANFIATGGRAAQDLNRFKGIIAHSIHAKADELHFCASGTSANNIAIKGYLLAHAEMGTHVICSVVDYPDLLTNAAFFEESGFDVTYLKCDSDGFVSHEKLAAAIREDTVLFMTTMANHTVGTIQPIADYRRVLDKCDHHVAMLVDGGQAYGRMPLDVREPSIDMLTFSAHKIHGPQGVGCLYIKKGILLSQTKHGVNRIDSLETGAISMANIAGFAKAVELAFNDLEANIVLMRRVSNHLIERIESEISHTLFNGRRGDKRACHNVNISFDLIEGEAVMMMLDMADIIVDTGSACASRGLKPNYILMAMERTHVQSHGSIKFTISRYTTIADVDKTVDKLKEIVHKLRERSTLYTEWNQNQE